MPWRRPISSLNYLLTSHVWRQDYNGFSHQDPGFIDFVMNKKAKRVFVNSSGPPHTDRASLRRSTASQCRPSFRGGMRTSPLMSCLERTPPPLLAQNFIPQDRMIQLGPGGCIFEVACAASDLVGGVNEKLTL